jgi:diguanylate cyclase (GGDEF)-like protein
MDILDGNNISLKLLVEYLDADQSQPLTKEQWRQMETNLGERIYPEILFLLTQMTFEPDEARKHWLSTLEHQEALSRILGRDVGLRVALCDYFTNILPKLKNPILIEVHLYLQKEKSILVDELTGLYNRRYLNRVLDRELQNTKRFKQPTSVLMVDVDHFKDYNDRLGHQAGDAALAEIARVLQRTARGIDHITRYGGEEFLLILPRTDKDAAWIAAERHRLAVQEHPFKGQEFLPNGNLTVTVGLATAPDDAEEGLKLLQYADEALYRGKSGGRNCVIPWSQNKRQHVRYPWNADMLFRRREPEVDSDYRNGQIRNISLGGLRCETETPVDIGQLLHLLGYLMEGSPPVRFQARVVYSAPDPAEAKRYHLGLSFDREASRPEAERALEMLVEQESRVLH